MRKLKLCLITNIISPYRIPVFNYLNLGLLKQLRKYNPNTIVLCGYRYLASWLSLLYSRRYGKKITLWAGSHLLSGFMKNRVTDFYKKAIIPRFDSYITYGTAAKEQIIYYGVAEKKITVDCNTVDINYSFLR